MAIGTEINIDPFHTREEMITRAIRHARTMGIDRATCDNPDMPNERDRSVTVERAPSQHREVWRDIATGQHWTLTAAGLLPEDALPDLGAIAAVAPTRIAPLTPGKAETLPATTDSAATPHDGVPATPLATHTTTLDTGTAL
ncbi:hypothetical protein ACQP2U_42450 (plasmid) [Nocardia sp. CA-084685]|uniref:hypothetical protein n=1 Tax=Nocardia sp. CA-084685 TaxID=3239970 RepID=UPI003D966A6D